MDINMDLGMDGDDPSTDEFDDAESDTEATNSDVKEIQSKTGTLGQTIRETSSEVIDSGTIKYVLNSIISAFDMSKLAENDRKEIIKALSSGGEKAPEKAEGELAENDELMIEPDMVDNPEDLEGSELSVHVPVDGSVDIGSVLNRFIRTISRYDKALAEKVKPFAKRESLRSRLKEVNSELSKMREQDINNMSSLEEEDV